MSNLCIECTTDNNTITKTYFFNVEEYVITTDEFNQTIGLVNKVTGDDCYISFIEKSEFKKACNDIEGIFIKD